MDIVIKHEIGFTPALMGLLGALAGLKSPTHEEEPPLRKAAAKEKEDAVEDKPAPRRRNPRASEEDAEEAPKKRSPAKTITLDEVRQVVRAKSKEGFGDEIEYLLTSAGADKVGDLTEDQIPAFYKVVKALVSDPE